MVINSCIAPTYLIIPTVHISNAIEITVLKEQDIIWILLDIRANLAVYLLSWLPAYLRNPLNIIWLLNIEYSTTIQKTYI